MKREKKSITNKNIGFYIRLYKNSLLLSQSFYSNDCDEIKDR